MHDEGFSSSPSVCLSVTNFDLNYLRPGEIEWAEIFLRISLSKSLIHNFFFLAGGRYGLGRGPKTNLLSKYIIFLLQAQAPKSVFLKVFTTSPNKSKIITSFAVLGARAALIGPILPVFAPKSHFWANSYLESHHLQGGMKFAKQISPLLNYIHILSSVL